MEKVSIIIPVFNTEKYLKRSLNSVINQTYKELEIIIIDDASKDTSLKIIEDFAMRDKRIVVIKNQKNQGAYHVRIAGIEAAKGDYIAFLDSDDFFGVDFIRLMVEKAENGKYEIVAGNTVHQNEYGDMFSLPLYDKEFENMPIYKEEILKRYFSQQGRAYIWHVIWNKIYKKDLVLRAVPFLKKMTNHLIMTEDIIISTIILSLSKSMNLSEHSYYYYCRNEGSATNLDSIEFIEYEKKLSDVIKVFDFTRDFLNAINLGSAYESDFYEFRKRYARDWERIAFKLKEEKSSALKMINDFCSDRGSIEEKEDKNLDYIWESFENKLETIKKAILNNKYRYISFGDLDRKGIAELYSMTEFIGKTAINGIFSKNNEETLHIGSVFYRDYIKALKEGVDSIFYPDIYEKEVTNKIELAKLLFENQKRSKKILLWGTGNICYKFIDRIIEEDIYGYIDNDINKHNKTFRNKGIFHPDFIEKYEDYYIIITTAAYLEIEAQLKGMNLSEYDDFIAYNKIIWTLEEK